MIKLDHILDRLDNVVVVIIEDLDGVDLQDNLTKEPALAKSHKAAVSRDLLRLADALALCEAEVREQYWLYKSEPI